MLFTALQIATSIFIVFFKIIRTIYVLDFDMKIKRTGRINV